MQLSPLLTAVVLVLETRACTSALNRGRSAAVALGWARFSQAQGVSRCVCVSV